MVLSRVLPCLLPLLALALWACSQTPQFIARDEPWRVDEERACLAAGVVRESAFVALRTGLGGPAVCGALKPFSVSAAVNGAVELRPPALLRCPMVPAIDHWVERVVMPAARRHLRGELGAVKIAGSYSCRPMNNVDGAGFVLADGRSVEVKSGWWGVFAQRNFLREVHHGSCALFSTVLGPNYDANHRDHFHLDLARHGRDGGDTICK
jgi:hypothetical protein